MAAHAFCPLKQESCSAEGTSENFFPYLSSKAEFQTQRPAVSLCTVAAFGGSQGAAVYFLKLFLLNQLRLQPQKEFKARRKTKEAVSDCCILGSITFLGLCLK